MGYDEAAAGLPPPGPGGGDATPNGGFACRPGLRRCFIHPPIGGKLFAPPYSLPFLVVTVMLLHMLSVLHTPIAVKKIAEFAVFSVLYSVLVFNLIKAKQVNKLILFKAKKSLWILL